MESISTYATEQYELLRQSRSILLEYCKTITQNDFLNENSSFGRGGSIRNLLVHIANTYEFWIAKYGLNKEIVFTSYDSIKNIHDLVNLFNTVDTFMFEFIQLLQKPDTEISYEINGIKNVATPFKLFTHVVTHEFHHKGQVLSLSRHLGYIPVDTDVMR